MLWGDGLKIYLCRDRIDMRHSYNGLSLRVAKILGMDPLSGHLFVFLNKPGTRLKVLFWDRNGFCLFHKRLEKGRFLASPFLERTRLLVREELYWLLSGYDLEAFPRVKKLNYQRVG